MKLHAPSSMIIGNRLPAALLALAAGLYLFQVSSTAQAQNANLPGGGQAVTLETKDGVLLQCTWYPGKPSKKTVPVVLVHGLEGQRKEWDSLAATLSKAGHAVLTVDLRGHGESMKARVNGVLVDIKPDRFNKNDYANMVVFDLEAVKKHLMAEHNAGNINIELLCLIGSEEGALFATNFAARDWSWPQLPALKQGQDVRAMVLISPEQNVRGYMMDLNSLPRNSTTGEVSTMIIVGKMNIGDYGDAKRLHNAFSRFHLPEPATPEDKKDKQDLILYGADTKLKGTKLLQPDLNLDGVILKFIEYRLTNKEMNYPWRNRP